MHLRSTHMNDPLGHSPIRFTKSFEWVFSYIDFSTYVLYLIFFCHHTLLPNFTSILNIPR